MVELPRYPLALLPSPVHRLDRLSAELGVDLWIKRDDLNGFALGGNKIRKIEYFLQAALDEGADVLVTCGAAQSNFIRQLGAACAVAGVGCQASVMDLPFEFGPAAGTHLSREIGNPQIDELVGVKLHWLEDGTWESLFDSAEVLAKNLEAQGKRVFRVPLGGSGFRGAYAFYQAGRELSEQLETPTDFVVTASSSGSTQTGLATYFHGSQTRVIGIACDPEPEFAQDLSTLSKQLYEFDASFPLLKAEDFHVVHGFVGPGYGIPSEGGQAALRKLATSEGIFLDPIYSAKAFDGLLNLIKTRQIGGKIVFWHTGGIPTLFGLPSLLKCSGRSIPDPC